MNSVDPRTPLRIVVTSDAGEIDIDALVVLSDNAWRRNYDGKVRVVYDADYYEWLLDGSDWFAALALTDDGKPVGFILSALRTLNCGGERFPAAYTTAWAVDPAYRRTGVSLRLWQANRDAIRERGYLGIAAAHGGYSGTRGGVVFRESAERRGVATVLQSGAIWSRALTGKAATPVQRASVGMRRLCFVDGPYPIDDQDVPVDRETFEQLVASNAKLAFAPSENFAQLYFNSALTRSGTMWLEPGGGARCAVGFSMFTLALDDAEIGLVGRIQFFLSFDGDDERTKIALEAMCSFLQRAGCSSVSLVDQRHIAHATLERCGFVRTPDEVTFSLWSREPPAAAFDDLSSCSLDWL
jgi:GNAT superfamily N-acetyltransferase